MTPLTPATTGTRRPRRVPVVCLVLALVLGPSMSVAAADTDDRAALEEQAQAATERGEQLRSEVEGLSTELAGAVLDLDATAARLPAAQQRSAAAREAVTGAERRLALVRQRLTDATDQRAALDAEVTAAATAQERLRASAASMARQAMQSGGAASLAAVAVAIDARDVAELTDGWQATATAQRAQAQVAEELAAGVAEARNAELRLTAVADRIATLTAQAEAELASADQARAAAMTAESALTALIAEQTAARDRLTGMRSQAEAELARAESERERLRQELAALTPVPSAPTSTTTTSGDVFFANPTAIQPMYVTSSYGMRTHPILGYQRLHAGIDLRTGCGTPLYAPRDATVRWAQWQGSFGNQVMLDYGTVDGATLMSSSNHMTSVAVSAGQQVSQGELIGYAGTTGLSTACHLHFEVYQNGSTIDPAPLLGR
ncbi:peptidoglycan DD-metalloendopeptidase family protein [Cellulomonas sp. NPDC089187]|uniref:M23 family metallopeptidase n=1 Tax=Cellulomonas sp. NPDC089187 TaxID=3154970 RepID=UPI00341D7481